MRRRWAPRSARCVGALLARRVASGAVIWIGGSCDPAFGCVASAVCACAAVAQATAPSATQLTENKAAFGQATAEGFRPELTSTFPPTELSVAIERNDLGAFSCPIPRALEPYFNSLMRFVCNAR